MGSLFISADAIYDTFPNNYEDAYNFGGGPYSANLMDAAGALAGQIAASTFGPFVYQGALYCLLNENTNIPPGTNPGVSFVVKSTDSGVTWVRLDTGNQPAFGQARGVFDNAHTIITAYGTSNGAGLAPLLLQNFDLSTGTWGPTYGAAGAPSGKNVARVYKRPDGTILVVYRSRIGFDADSSSGLGCAIYDPTGGVWVTSFDAGANLLALTGWDSTQTTCSTTSNELSGYMDAAGNVGLFFSTVSTEINPVIWDNRCFYQQIQLDNSLGSFFDFPGQVQPLNTFNWDAQELVAQEGGPLGRPVLLPTQDLIVLPVLQTNRTVADRFPKQLACVYIGTGIRNPVWSIDPLKTIDPDSLTNDSIWPINWGSATFDGTTISVVFAAAGEDFGSTGVRLRLCQTTNLASPADGWTAQTVIDLQVTPIAVPDGGGLNFLRFTGAAVSFGEAVPPPPTPVFTPQTVVGGGHDIQSHCGKPNLWDLCLDEQLRLRSIKFPPLCSIPQEFRNLLPWDLDAAIPPQAVPFRTVGGILTPATAAGDQTIVSLRVPHGYDGLLTGIYWLYSGDGFDQGSGDLIFRLQLNRRYLKDLSNVPFLLGSPVTPVPLTEGAILFSDQTLQAIVNVPNLSGMIQIGASTISAGLLGFYWPR